MPICFRGPGFFETQSWRLVWWCCVLVGFAWFSAVRWLTMAYWRDQTAVHDPVAVMASQFPTSRSPLSAVRSRDVTVVHSHRRECTVTSQECTADRVTAVWETDWPSLRLVRALLFGRRQYGIVN